MIDIILDLDFRTVIACMGIVVIALCVGWVVFLHTVLR